MLDFNGFLSNFPNHILAVGLPTKEGGKFFYHNLTTEEVKEQNLIRHKGDVYFTPNGDYKLVYPDESHLDFKKRNNKGKRTKTNAKNIYAFIAEIDNKDQIWKNYPGLDNPSFVIETCHGFHLYYLLENPLLFSDFQNEFKDIEDRLIVLFNGDKQCNNIDRLLRVPEFKYRKDNKGEIEIKIIDDNGGRFKFTDFQQTVNQHYISAGKDNEEKKVITKKIKDKTLASSWEDFFDEVKRIDVIDVLYDLYGSYYEMKGKGMYEGGKFCDGYKYCKRGNYLNPDFSGHERPSGGPYSVAKFYYKNTSDVIDYFVKRWNIEFKRFNDMRPILGDSVEELKKPNQPEEKKKSIRYGGASNGIIIDYEGEKIIQYYDKGESEYVNGVVDSYGFYRNGDTKRYIIKTIKNGVPEIKTLPLIGGGSDLRKFLMSMGLIVGESKQGLIYLLKYLTSVNKEYKYTECLGLQIIDGKKVLVKKGGIYIDEEQNLFVNIPETTGEFISDSWSSVSIKDFTKQLIEGYNGTISFVTFLTICLGVNARFFRNAKIKLPQFFLMGLSQTGKSCFLENIFKRGFGVSLEMAAGSKTFVYQKMSKHYLPIHFGEYRNTSVNKEEIEGQLRILFDGTEGTKGKADQSIVYYPSNAMYVLDGQATFTDDAVLTRLFLLIANPRDKRELEKLVTLPNILGKVIDIFKDEKDFDKFIKLCVKHRKIIKESISLSRENDRMLDNYSFLYGLSEWLGLQEYNKYIDECMARQDGYLAVDDIKSTYQKAFNLQQIHHFDINIYGKGLVIGIVEEYLKSNNIADFKGIIKTVNQHFLHDEYPFIGMEVYIDLEYIYRNKQLRNPFIRSLRRLLLSGEYTPEEHKTLGSLREFIADNFKGNPIVEDLSIELKTAKVENKYSEF